MVERLMPAGEDPRDLGFGSRVAALSSGRLLNRDGTFNATRRGLGFWASLSVYNTLLTLSWPAFTLLLGSTYLTANAVFALGYRLCGPGALRGPAGPGAGEQFLQAFFFSVQTLSTIGYGHVVPTAVSANLLVTLESMLGLFGIALATGLVFARFSRPTASIAFSRNAIIAPYRGMTAFELRIANRRKNELIDLEARVVFSRMEKDGGRWVRRFHPLPLERERVSMFPLSWTIVHPIDEKSPFWGMSRDDALGADLEILVLLTGIDETHSQTVHARSSYRAEEIVWNARFQDIFRYPHAGGPVHVDVSRIHDIQPLETAPDTSAP